MENCTVETGLLKKKPCGHAAVTNCLNCERALCAQHAIAEATEAGKRTGKFLCQECKAALKEHAKSMAAVERKEQQKKDLAAAKSAMAPPAVAPKKPAAPAPAAPVAPAPAVPAAPAEGKGAYSSIEFTPAGGNKGKSK